MSTIVPVSNHALKLKQAIAAKNHSSSLQILKQLPLRKRWETLLLLNQSFSTHAAREYVQALAHDLLYRAYQAELSGQDDEALRLYRLLIQHTSGKKVVPKAREGYQRVKLKKVQPFSKESLQPDAPLDPNSISLLIIEPIAPSEKQAIAIEFAKILKTDPYTARLALPSLEFRIFRHGLSSEISPIQQALTTAGISSRQFALKTIQEIPVHDVLSITGFDSDRITVEVRDPDHTKQSRSLSFEWANFQQRVNGLLPLFEEVIIRNKKGKLIRKTETQDHAQICDLHLKNQQGILRFYDAGYQFNQGISLVSADSKMSLEVKTSWAQWQGLKSILAQSLPPISEHQKFENFATTTVEQIEFLTHINAQIHILRRHECYWDQSFHLYSALHYLRCD